MPITVEAWRRPAPPDPPADPLIDPDTPAGQQPLGQSSGWTLAMSEEFNGAMTVTDAGQGFVRFRDGGMTWATWYPDWPRFNAQDPGGNHTNTNVDGYYQTDRVSTSGGSLILDAVRDQPVSGLNYSVGMIQSIQAFTPKFGFIESRLRCPSMPTSFWPAAWMSCSDYNEWPPEVDYYEDGLTGQVLNNVYGGETFKSNAGPSSLSLDWHTYGAKWDTSGTTFYLDGAQVNQTTNSPDTQMYVLFDVAIMVSGSFQSAHMEVDYVRYWQEA